MPDRAHSAGAIDAQERILAWYQEQGRDLPWRRTRDPYAILVAEVMLQQTGVDRVLPKYSEFLEAFPSLADLAAAPRAEVIRRWAPLGYNRRAVALHEITQQVLRDFGGRFPTDRDSLQQLKGIGPYTAGAIACFAFGNQNAFLDTNIRRVVGRIWLGGEPDRTAAGERALQAAAEAAVPAGRAYDWHQALMDLGATICRSAKPKCLMCPARPVCRSASGEATAKKLQPRPPAGPFVGSSRYYRGRVVDSLRGAAGGLDLDQIGADIKPGFAPDDRVWLATLLAGLEADGLVRRVAEDSEIYRLG